MITECYDTRRSVPLYKVVAAAMVDAYEDISKAGVQQTYFHWASRGILKLNNEVIKLSNKKVLLHVNSNTHTATLPLDFREETFVGVIDSYGQKVPLRLRTDLSDTNNIEDIACDDSKCPKCDQNLAICTDLTVTEDTKLIIINDSVYEQTVIKKLYPDGSYYLETRIPVLNIETNVVEYTTQKEFIAALSLKPCGCIEDTTENIEIIRCNAYETYCTYYAPCCGIGLDSSYQIFDETGVMKFNPNFGFDKVYLEYRGYLPKKNGQYQVPEVCFETLVNWIKYKSVANRKGISLGERQLILNDYIRERRNMEKIIGGRISLQHIMESISLIPKFDANYVRDEYYLQRPTPTILPTDECNAMATTTATCAPPCSQGFVPFDIAVVAGNGTGTPTPGVNTYQNNKLIGALGVNNIIVNNANESQVKLEFTIDTSLGVIHRFQGDGVTPNNWFAGDSLIITTFFKLI